MAPRRGPPRGPSSVAGLRPRRSPASSSSPSQGSFAALAHTEYRRLWIAGVSVFFAVMAQNIARGWLAFELTGSNAGLGGVLMGFGIVMLVATPFGGVAADRLSKRFVILAATALLGLTSGAIGVATAMDAVEYWMLVVASGLQAVAFAFYGPARMAFIGELLPPETMGNGIVLGQMGAEGSRVIGPAIAGVLIGAFADGTATVFLLSAALCAVSFVLCLTLPPGTPAPGRPARSVFAEMSDGVRYVRQHAALRLLVLTSLGTVIVGFPYIAFLPTLADDIFDRGSSGYGFMSAVSAAGAVLAALLTARVASPVRQVRDLGRAGLLFGAAVLVLGAVPRFELALVALAVAGAAGLWFQTTNQSLLLSIGAFEFHGRIQSLVMLGFSGFGIAALPLGIVADAVGLRTTFAVMGGIVAAIGVVFVRRSGTAMGPSVRSIEPPL